MNVIKLFCHAKKNLLISFSVLFILFFYGLEGEGSIRYLRRWREEMEIWLLWNSIKYKICYSIDFWLRKWKFSCLFILFVFLLLFSVVFVYVLSSLILFLSFYGSVCVCGWMDGWNIWSSFFSFLCILPTILLFNPSLSWLFLLFLFNFHEYFFKIEVSVSL